MDYLLKRPDTQARCIWKVLASKRLLVDHLELVEMCLKLDHSMGNAVSKFVWPRKTICAGCICIIAVTTRFSPSYISNKWQVVASTTSALLLGAMAYEEVVVYRDVAKVTSLIESMELYDHAMKKALMFVNELVFGKQRISFLKDFEIEREMLRMSTENCIKAIYDMYGFVKILEKKTVLRDEYNQFYDPLETLESCEVFKQMIPSQTMAKELHNIFLYMQSHCLLRLSLAILSDVKIGEIKDEANHLIGCLTSHANELKKRTMLLGVPQLDDLEVMNVVKQTSSKELLSVKQQSLELTAKLAANTLQLMLIDENIQAHSSPPSYMAHLQLRDTANNLAAIHSIFLTRMDECERLLITVKKLLNCIEHPKQKNEDPADIEPAQEGTSDELLPESHNAAHELRDEFFLNTGTEGEEDPNDSTSAMYNLLAEDELVSKRLMKKQFQPILQQLRERLVPVKESFKERERVALQLNGIIMQDEEESYDAYRTHMASRSITIETDDESDCEEFEMKMRYNRSQNKYKDDRDFLASKPQISFLASLPKVAQMDENILE
uniref:Vezatin n=1 Tax=Anopheles minimus TaxID=112268 RepID=A0A182W477_9DIPT